MEVCDGWKTSCGLCKGGSEETEKVGQIKNNYLRVLSHWYHDPHHSLTKLHWDKSAPRHTKTFSWGHLRRNTKVIWGHVKIIISWKCVIACYISLSWKWIGVCCNQGWIINWPKWVTRPPVVAPKIPTSLCANWFVVIWVIFVRGYENAYYLITQLTR